MKYTIVRLFLVAVSSCAVALPSNTASAGWGLLQGGGSNGGSAYGSYGSSGGSYVANYGSSGGGYSSYNYGGSSGGGSGGAFYGSSGGGSSGGASRGPGPLRRLAARLHDHKVAKQARRASYGSSGGSSGGYYSSGYGSSGSYGSSGGYVTSYGSGGSSGYSTSYGSSGGFGSSGGYGASYGSAGSIDVAPAVPYTGGYLGVSNESSASAASLASHQTSSSDAIYLNVSVPAAAKVYVNDMATTSTGASRQYISRGLIAGKKYKFEIRAEVLAADGTVATETKSVSLGAGQQEAIDFASLDQTVVQTAVTVNVPADARVVLAGNLTNASGETRTFRTAQLRAGEQWDDYVVEVHHDGKVKRETLRLVAGDDVALTFNFDDEKSLVASR